MPKLYVEQKGKAISECISCGICVEGCPFIKFSDLVNEDPVAITADVLNVLKGELCSELAYKRAFSCVQCGACVNSCPQGLNVYLLQGILRTELIAQGRHPMRGRSLRIADRRYSEIDLLSLLVLKPEERRWVYEVPPNPGHRDIVLYLGCEPTTHPDQCNTMIDILSGMGINFVTIAGSPRLLCCGAPYQSRGKPQQADEMALHLIDTISSFSPQKLISVCPMCSYRLKNELDPEINIPFEIEHASQFLANNLDKLAFIKKIDKTVTMLNSCKLGRLGGEWEASREILRAIPGIELIETPLSKEEACCGGESRYFPQFADAVQRQTMDRVKETGADFLVSDCSYCHRNYCAWEKDYPYQSRGLLSLVGEALGVEYEDLLGRYIRYHDPERVLRESKEVIESSPYSIEEMQQLVPRILP